MPHSVLTIIGIMIGSHIAVIDNTLNQLSSLTNMFVKIVGTLKPIVKWMNGSHFDLINLRCIPFTSGLLLLIELTLLL